MRRIYFRRDLIIPGEGRGRKGPGLLHPCNMRGTLNADVACILRSSRLHCAGLSWEAGGMKRWWERGVSSERVEGGGKGEGEFSRLTCALAHWHSERPQHLAPSEEGHLDRGHALFRTSRPCFRTGHAECDLLQVQPQQATARHCVTQELTTEFILQSASLIVSARPGK